MTDLADRAQPGVVGTDGVGAPVAREIPLAGQIATLLEAARHGDQAAWDGLVARFNGLVWSIARGYRLDVADAHDAVQMTWLRLVENLNRISEPDRLAAWLARPHDASASSCYGRRAGIVQLPSKTR